MDKYDELLKEINREKRIKADTKAFWEFERWNKEQLRKMELQMEPPLQINIIKSGLEFQRELMREKMGLSDTEGLTLTKENMEKLISDLTEATQIKGKVLSNGIIYKDFIHFSGYLINKYFTKE